MQPAKSARKTLSTNASGKGVASPPPGAVFHRCALQVNPHHYGGTYRGKGSAGDATQHAQAIVAKAVELGISVLAITDHNDVAGLPAFRAAAEGKGVHVFPGFELSSSEGVHVLCIYPPDTSQEKLGRFLGAFGVTTPGSSPDLCNKSFSDVLPTVRDQGGVTIAAHVTEKKGLLNSLHGQARIRAWQCDDLLAIQIPGAVADLPQDLRPIVENTNSDYARAHPAEDRLALAVVNAKDIVKAEDLEDPSGSCWIKMSEVSIEGLRQAFLDPGSRIRLNPSQGRLEPEEHAELLGMSWETEGFMRGLAFRFNPNLNVLIGGRGTGKSTIVESIRTVLALVPNGDEARKAHDGIMRYVLRSGTKISLRVRVHRPAAREYTIERTLPNPPIVKDDDGEVSSLSPQDVLPRIEVYGQHEISELTRSREKLTRLLDRFVEPENAALGRRGELKRELEKSRRGILDTRRDLARIEERLAALPGLEETLKRFQEAGLEERLKEQSLLVREEQLLSSIPERLARFRECLDALTQGVPLDRAFVSAKALEDLPGKKILTRLNAVFADLDRDLEAVIKALQAALERADGGFAEVRSEWSVRKQEVQAAYEKILRELQKSAVDGEAFIRLRRQIEELRPLRERQQQAQRLEKDHGERRRKLLAEWEDFKAAEFRRLDRAAKKVSKQLQGRVQVEVTAAGDREPLFEMLKEVGGRFAEAIDRLRGVTDLSLTRLVEAARTGAGELTKVFGITPAQAERLAKADPEVLLRIEELELHPTTAIRLNTAPQGAPPAWQTLEDLSTGQKATAVLLLLLLESDAPLVVDQPEDDLDNRFITEGVVPRMREEKQRRQFIFSTHNANIPVLGDAELIVGLTASGEADGGRARIRTEHVGSIDARPVRELVEEILEGGKEAFERRRRKYGF